MNIKGMDAWLSLTTRMNPLCQDAVYYRLGKVFPKTPLSVAEQAELGRMLAHIHAFRVGECYMNSGMIALAQDRLNFCEGVAAGLWPVDHAWVSYKGRAIDVTWPLTWGRGSSPTSARYTPSEKAGVIMRRVVHNLKTCTYWGIEIPRDLLRDHFIDQEKYMPLFDPNCGRNWPKFEKRLFGSSTIKEARAASGII